MKTTFEILDGTYRQEGDYLIPDVEVPESPKIGIWGERRRRYLRGHEKATYTAMLLRGTLNAHLEEVDRSASEMFGRLVVQITEQEGVTEPLKATNQMEWAQRMNNIRSRVNEIINAELVFQ